MVGQDAGDSIQRLETVFAAQPVPGVVCAYVFGSVAEGRTHRESDVDVGVFFDRRIYPDDRSRFDAQLDLRRHLSPSIVGREIDVVVLNDVSPVLGRRILRGRRVFCADSSADHALQRDVQLRAADLEPFLRRMRTRLLETLRR